MLERSAVTERVNEALAKLLDPAAARGVDTIYGELFVNVRELVLRGGKRLRPYLVYLAYEGCGGKNNPSIFEVAATHELLHAFLLIHDDVMDRDLVRWGGPNITSVYQERFAVVASAATARHTAEAMAIVGGDVLCGLTFGALAASDFAPERKIEAITRTSQAIFEVCGGQVLDVCAPLLPPEELTHERLLQVCRYKTGSYSFAAPLELGAILAAAPADVMKGLHQYALAMGIAYQLTDDLLGIYGDEVTLGKSVLSDLREGKRTVLMSYGLELATPEQRQYVLSALGNPTITPKTLETVRAHLDACGAHAKTIELAEQYAKQARAALSTLEITEAAKAELRKLTNDSLYRQR